MSTKNQTFNESLGNVHYIFSLVFTYYGMVIILAGLIGNVLIVLIMYWDTSLRISTRIWTMTLSIVDNFVLLVPGIRYWLIVKPDEARDLRISSEWSCKIHVFLTYMAIDSSSFLLSILGMERLALVLYPTATWLKTNLKRKTIVALIALLGVDFMKNVKPNFYTIHLKSVLSLYLS
jgi:hypothetical protein